MSIFTALSAMTVKTPQEFQLPKAKRKFSLIRQPLGNDVIIGSFETDLRPHSKTKWKDFTKITR